jgi:glucokinase
MLAATGLGATSLALTGTASALAASDSGAVALAPLHQTAFALAGAFEHGGGRTSGVGFLSDVYGLSAATPGNDDAPGTRLTFVLSGKNVTDTTLPGLQMVTVEGDLTISLVPRPPDDFSNPRAFSGSTLAVATARLQIVNVLGAGVATLTGDIVQNVSNSFAFGVRRYAFGKKGAAMRVSATGPSTPLASEQSRATHHLAGAAVVTGGTA